MVRCSPGPRRHVVAQHGVGEAVGIADFRAGPQAAPPRANRRPARPRQARANAARRLHRLEAQRAVDPEGAAVPSQGLDRAGAAAVGEELRRRIRLEGPPGEREREPARPLAEVAHRVANDRQRIVGRAGAEGGDVQAEIADTPVAWPAWAGRRRAGSG